MVEEDEGEVRKWGGRVGEYVVEEGGEGEGGGWEGGGGLVSEIWRSWEGGLR